MLPVNLPDDHPDVRRNIGAVRPKVAPDSLRNILLLALTGAGLDPGTTKSAI